jgi:hypothetical protein
MENTDHKNEEEAFHEKPNDDFSLSLWQEWGIVLLSSILVLIGSLGCIILADIYRSRAWAKEVRTIGYIVLVPHIVILLIFVFRYFIVPSLMGISIVVLFILPILYLIWGYAHSNLILESVLVKVGSIFLLIPIFCIIYLVISIPLVSLNQCRRSAWENRCKLTLRALGSSQQAFMDDNPDKNYGTWREMIDADYIQYGYNRTNTIDNYSIVVFIVHKSTFDEKGNNNFDSTFSIVAIPRSVKNRLRTFSIGDDQIPRVWVGKSEDWTTENVSLRNIDLWEPLR